MQIPLALARAHSLERRGARMDDTVDTMAFPSWLAVPGWPPLPANSSLSRTDISAEESTCVLHVARIECRQAQIKHACGKPPDTPPALSVLPYRDDNGAPSAC